jgi:hypothetical protein
MRYKQTARTSDLMEVIKAARTAVQIAPLEHPDRAGMLNNLGFNLANLYE